MQLTWKTIPDVSICYALAARVAGRTLVDERLAAELDALLQRTSPLVGSTRDARDVNPRVDFWQRMCLYSSRLCSSSPPGWSATDADSDASGPRSGGAGLRGSSPPGWSLTASLAELVAAARELSARHLPRLASELPLRVRPFHELWEARGPGLLRQVFRQWDRDEPNQTCLVSWVHPVCGGGGWSDSESHTVLLEAVLVNPIAPLPEVLRLAYLVVHAFITNHRSTRKIAEQGGEALASLALVPAVLAAGEHVELTVCNASQIAAALNAWLDIPEPRAAQLGTMLAAWWEERATSGLSWQAALQRLAM